jgi:hypothetical protein
MLFRKEMLRIDRNEDFGGGLVRVASSVTPISCSPLVASPGISAATQAVVMRIRISTCRRRLANFSTFSHPEACLSDQGLIHYITGSLHVGLLLINIFDCRLLPRPQLIRKGRWPATEWQYLTSAPRDLMELVCIAHSHSQ